MIGDNVEADVLGAERAGLNAVLVRSHDPRVRWSCAGLDGVLSIVTAAAIAP